MDNLDQSILLEHRVGHINNAFIHLSQEASFQVLPHKKLGQQKEKRNCETTGKPVSQGNH